MIPEHPYLLLQLHHQRAAELQREAWTHQHAHPGRVRRRIGWALVGLGLRMAAPRAAVSPV
ncbi:hypothetical protein U9R90_32525 [Streptomyces sp. E11-3]|uniref:hypothetical protein n=1 Tax=Streptomyces sp. E11-3 TaxID=3110112 RepID=UPI0039805694